MSHYFENNPSLKSNIQKHEVKIKEQSYIFYTDNGVFSKKGLDFGTRSLLENIDLQALQGDLLDFGCGYGPIGIYLARNTNCQIDMIDINERSLDLARKNALANHADVHIFSSNIYENVTKKYDHIVSNPPIRVGKQILYDILIGASKHLKQNGSLWIVVSKNQGAKSIMKDLEKYYEVTLIAKNKEFFVIMFKMR